MQIGDHKQLRPKVEFHPLSVASGGGHDLNVSLFERLVTSGFPHAALAVQHRMHPDISELVRECTYPHLQVGYGILQLYEWLWNREAVVAVRAGALPRRYHEPHLPAGLPGQCGCTAATERHPPGAAPRALH